MTLDKKTEEKIFAITRPHNNLFWLYFIRSLAALIMFPFVFGPLFCKYLTLKYQFENEGVGASWGVFFKKQVFLTYGRIQDIHVNRGLIERWLGLGTVNIQTASGSSGAELSIVGLEEYDEIRDFLYSKMRGAKGQKQDEAQAGEVETVQDIGDALAVLHAIRDELAGLRQTVQVSKGHQKQPKAKLSKKRNLNVRH